MNCQEHMVVSKRSDHRDADEQQARIITAISQWRMRD
jgi:hypothetical protein